MQAHGTPNSAVSDAACRSHPNFRAIGGRLASETDVRRDPCAAHRRERAQCRVQFRQQELDVRHRGKAYRAIRSQAQLTLAVFAGSTIVAVLARFAEERLGLLWREFVTERAIAVYMANGTYHRLATSGELATRINGSLRMCARLRRPRFPSRSWRSIAPSRSFPFPGYVVDQPPALRHLRRLCRARLVSDDQARPAAR